MIAFVRCAALGGSGSGVVVLLCVREGEVALSALSEGYGEVGHDVRVFRLCAELAKLMYTCDLFWSRSARVS